MEDVGDELEDEISAGRIPYELNVVRSKSSGKEVLDRKNDLCKLCREGCSRHKSYMVEPIPFSVQRSKETNGEQ